MASFFELDRDEILFSNRTYLDYFNLYPNLSFTSTLAHLESLDGIAVLDSSQSSDGWQIAVKFDGLHFLLDTRYHGTSTLFCVASEIDDDSRMLAFLGCFVPLLRDNWR